MKKLLMPALFGLLSLLPIFKTLADSSSNTQIIEFKSGADGFDTRTFFYITSNEVVAIDAQFTPKLAEESIKHLRTFTDKPITTLIITHPNPDKFNGASVFKKLGARIVSSKATSEAILSVHQYKKYYFVEIAKMFTNENYPVPTPVDVTFSGEKIISLGEDELILKELKAAGVSSTQTVVLAKRQNAIFVGDLVHHKAHAWLEGGIVDGKAVPTITGWVSALKELNTLYSKSNPLVYGGRGVSALLKESVRDQINYLNKSVKIVQARIVKNAMTKNDVGSEKEKVFYGELEKDFVREFPDYGLSYMINYGAYGLVHSLLK